jgi:hypothetical protein
MHAHARSTQPLRQGRQQSSIRQVRAAAGGARVQQVRGAQRARARRCLRELLRHRGRKRIVVVLRVCLLSQQLVDHHSALGEAQQQQRRRERHARGTQKRCELTPSFFLGALRIAPRLAPRVQRGGSKPAVVRGKGARGVARGRHRQHAGARQSSRDGVARAASARQPPHTRVVARVHAVAGEQHRHARRSAAGVVSDAERGGCGGRRLGDDGVT